MTPQTWITTTSWLILALIAVSVLTIVFYTRTIKRLRAEEDRAKRRLEALDHLTREMRKRWS